MNVNALETLRDRLDAMLSEATEAQQTTSSPTSTPKRTRPVSTITTFGRATADTRSQRNLLGRFGPPGRLKALVGMYCVSYRVNHRTPMNLAITSADRAETTVRWPFNHGRRVTTKRSGTTEHLRSNVLFLHRKYLSLEIKCIKAPHGTVGGRNGTEYPQGMHYISRRRPSLWTFSAFTALAGDPDEGT
jgi:hypothetical protein